MLLIMIVLGHTNLGNEDLANYLGFNSIEINDEHIRFSQKGEGPDILLVHGTPGSIEDWDTIVDSLAKDYTVTSFDRLGHGYSSSNTYTYHLKDNAILIEHLIEVLKLETPLIVGHSYGGSIAAYMAVNSTINDRAYIIIDSPLYHFEPKKTYHLIAIPVLGKGISLFGHYTVANNEIKKGLLSLLELLPKEQASQLIAERQKIWSQPKVIYSISNETVNYQNDLDLIASEYQNITSDIIIVTGNDASQTFKNDCKKFHSEVNTSELIILNKTRHYIQFDRPNELLKIIREKMEQQLLSL